MNVHFLSLSFLTPTAILLAGLIDDLYTRKVHNGLVLGLCGLAIAAHLWIGGVDGLVQGGLAAGFAFLITLPLVLMNALGAGDMKLLIAFGLSAQWPTVFWVVVYSMIWGAVFGLLVAILRGQALSLILRTIDVATRKKIDPVTLQKIPYTVPLFFGWLTHLSQTTGGL